MKIIKSKNYTYKEIIRNSEYDPDIWHDKIQSITEQVHQGIDIYQAINKEFSNLSKDKLEQIKDYVFQSLGKSVPTSNQDAYSAY